MKTTPELITKLGWRDVFVFGSNTRGRHGGGAALVAHERFGAEWGIGEGRTGKCYAFPTLDASHQKLDIGELQMARDRLFAACRKEWWRRFLLTRVGTGIAGYDEKTMRGLFGSYPWRPAPRNLIKPPGW